MDIYEWRRRLSGSLPLASAASIKSRRWCIALIAVSLIVLSVIAFASKSPLVFYRFDGTYLLMFATVENVWSIGGWDFTTNPLQGIGGLDLPWRALLDPSLWMIPRLGPLTGPVVAMTVYAVELAATIAWLGLRLKLSPTGLIAAIWIGLLLAFPYVYPSLGFDFLWGVPSYVPLIAEDTVVILLFFDLGKGPPRIDLARAAAVVCICALQTMEYPNFAPVSLVVLAFFGLVALVTATSMRERAVKLVGAAAAAGLTLGLFGQMVFALYGFAKPTYFWEEFYPRPGTLRDLSFFIADYSRWPAWVAYALAFVGGIQGAWRGTPAMRSKAYGFLAFVAVNLILVFTAGEGWRGPRIAYIDIFAYPFYCAFAGHAVDTLLRPLAASPGLLARRPAAIAALLSVLPWLVLVDLRPPPLDRPLVRNLNPFIWPPSETPVTGFLKEAIGLVPGAAFRGRIANIAGSDSEPEWAHVPFIAQHNFDGISLFFSGNDHRMYGLWYYGIPTLIELNQFSSPFFHVVNARLLNAPGSRDVRSYETQSIVNDRVMALLGVRYLLSDKRMEDRSPALGYRLVEGRDLYVYPVADTNVAGYAVRQVRQVATAQEAVAILADAPFDPRDTAVLTAAREVPSLVPVSSSGITVERGGYRVVADSPGTSLLVLPIEYSHCLHAALTSSTSTPPSVLRADLTLAAILFSGHLEGRLMLRYGPFSSKCRIEDWREADVVKIGQATEWPAPH
jgi:hypothetical protein